MKRLILMGILALGLSACHTETMQCTVIQHNIVSDEYTTRTVTSLDCGGEVHVDDSKSVYIAPIGGVVNHSCLQLGF